MDREFDSFLNFENGTTIWTGVVEDRFDPLMIGRVRVRIFGIHSPDREEIPTDCLPWASVILPVTEAGSSGIGNAVPGIVEGSWVIGFFRDGQSCQDPLILGSLPGIAPPDWQGGTTAVNAGAFAPQQQQQQSSTSPIDPNAVPFVSLNDAANAVQSDLLSSFGDPMSSFVQDTKREMTLAVGIDPSTSVERVFPELTSFIANNPSFSLSSPNVVLPTNVEAEMTAFATNVTNATQNSVSASLPGQVSKTLNVQLSSSSEQALQTSFGQSFVAAIQQQQSTTVLQAATTAIASSDPQSSSLDGLFDRLFNDFYTSGIEPSIRSISQSISDPVATITRSQQQQTTSSLSIDNALSGFSENILADIVKTTGLEGTLGIANDILNVQNTLKTTFSSFENLDFSSIATSSSSIGLAVDALNNIESQFSGTLEIINGGASSLMGFLNSSPSDIASSVLDSAIGQVQGLIQTTINSTIGNSLELIQNAFGSVLAPIQQIETSINQITNLSSDVVNGISQFTSSDVFTDGMSLFKMESFFSGNEIFNLFDETGAALFESLKATTTASFQDIGRGIVPSLEPGSLGKKPVSHFPIFPSESDINRASRGHESLFKPGGMKYNYDKSKDPNWSEPDMHCEPVYPYNAHKETESGHVIEFDDTPDHERMQIRHKSGTGLHINPDGTQKQEVHGDSFSIYVKDNKAHVYGTLELFVDIDARVSIVGDSNITIGSNAKISVGGNCQIDCENKIDVMAKGDLNLSAGRNLNLKAGNAIVATTSPSHISGTKFKGESEDQRTGAEENYKGILFQTLDEDIAFYTNENIVSVSEKMTSFMAKEDVRLYAEGYIDGFAEKRVRFQETPLVIESRDDPKIIRQLSLDEPHELKNHPKQDLDDQLEGVFDDSGQGLNKQEHQNILKEGAVKGGLQTVKYSNRGGGVELPSSAPHDAPTRSFGASNNGTLTPSAINEVKQGPYTSTKNPVYDLQLSNHLYLRDLTWGTVVSKGNVLVPRFGNTEQDIIFNLANLAKSIDPIFDAIGKPTFSSFGRKPGNVTINSAFRKNSGQGSSHSHGCAVDIQVVGMKPSKYFDLAIQIEEILAGNGGYDHILLEYARRANNPWIHIGIWTSKARGLCLTYKDDRKYADKFINLGQSIRKA